MKKILVLLFYLLIFFPDRVISKQIVVQAKYADYSGLLLKELSEQNIKPQRIIGYGNLLSAKIIHGNIVFYAPADSGKSTNEKIVFLDEKNKQHEILVNLKTSFNGASLRYVEGNDIRVNPVNIEIIGPNGNGHFFKDESQFSISIRNLQKDLKIDKKDVNLSFSWGAGKESKTLTGEHFFIYDEIKKTYRLLAEKRIDFFDKLPSGKIDATFNFIDKSSEHAESFDFYFYKVKYNKIEGVLVNSQNQPIKSLSGRIIMAKRNEVDSDGDIYSQSSIVNSDGKFEFNNLPIGDYNICVVDLEKPLTACVNFVPVDSKLLLLELKINARLLLGETPSGTIFDGGGFKIIKKED